MIAALQVTLTWGDVLIVAAIAVLVTVIVARLG
jgi:hypothetical protein